MQLSHSLFLITVSVTSLVGQTTHREILQTAERRQTHPHSYSILDLAAKAPPELRALALLRIGAQSQIPDRAWRGALLEEAFEVARSVHLSSPVLLVRLPSGPPSQTMLSRSAQATMRNIGVDRLSLQTAITRTMNLVDSIKAAELFEAIELPKIGQSECSMSFVADTDQYFKTAISVINNAPAGKRASLVVDVIGSVSSLVQVPAILNLFGEVWLDGAGRTSAAIALGNVIRSLPRDSRAWVVGLNTVTDLMNTLTSEGGAETHAILVDAWRSYLLAGLSIPSCSDILDPTSEYFAWRKKGLDVFNELVKSQNTAPGITNQEIRSERIPVEIVSELPPDSDRVKSIQKLWWQLVFGEGRVGLSNSDKLSEKWTAKFSIYLAMVEDLTAADVPVGRDVMWQKARLFGDAIAITTKGYGRQHAFERYVQLMTDSNIESSDVWKWLSFVDSWLSSCDSLGFSRKDALDLLENSGEPWLELVGKLDPIAYVVVR